MDEFFFSLAIDAKKTLCIGPITRREAASLGDLDLGSGAGLYLYFADSEARDSDITVIGKIGNSDSASLMANMIRSGKLDFHSV